MLGKGGGYLLKYNNLIAANGILSSVLNFRAKQITIVVHTLRIVALVASRKLLPPCSEQQNEVEALLMCVLVQILLNMYMTIGIRFQYITQCAMPLFVCCTRPV